jgi:hypothetical protein
MSGTISGRTAWGEGRRLRAWELKQQGWPQRAIARALGVTEGAVSQWCTRAREQGAAALRPRPAPGPTPKLPPAQLRLVRPTQRVDGAGGATEEAVGLRQQVVEHLVDRAIGVDDGEQVPQALDQAPGGLRRRAVVGPRIDG